MPNEAVKQVNPTFPMIAMRGIVLFPKMVLHFDIGREKSIAALEYATEHDRKVFLAAQKDVQDEDPTVDNIYSVGVVGEVKQVIKIPGAGLRVMVEGLYRAKVVNLIDDDSCLIAEVKKTPLKRLLKADREVADAMMRAVKDLFKRYSELSPRMPKEIMLGVVLQENPAALSEFIAGNAAFEIGDKQKILEESSVLGRLQLLAGILERENEILAIERDFYQKVKDKMDTNQKEYYLREQMKVISEELGETDDFDDEVNEYLNKIAKLNLPIDTAEKLTKECNKLQKMSPMSQEAAVIRNYLDECMALPWNRQNEIKSDLQQARKILDRDHCGLEKIKDRIIESIAVKKLAPDMKGQILCLVGPPGVGKTSVAKSIAEATGRDYVRISLGGVRDEADIRGHRKTYVGAMPGRIMEAMKRAKSKNPLMLLDEIDKLGTDYKGDPSSALLEVLDPEQNFSFRDHYIEVPFDLSKVLFIATANNADTIPAPLYDRMEIINLSSYTRNEKLSIAKEHLVPKERKRHGLTGNNIRISDEALFEVIDYYTREAGVRKLEQLIAKIMRKAAVRIVSGKKGRITVMSSNVEEFLGPRMVKPDSIFSEDKVGIANGLAWTSVGGEMLQIEVAVLPGTGKLELTGHLGDVMKESAHTAVSLLRSRALMYGLDEDFYKTKDIHIHVPEGAVPKDGPSAGITLCTALLSALSNVAVRRDVAMTGEITLTGRVLPIGGLKEKTMAAYRFGVKKVIIPEDNKGDLSEIDKEVREKLEFITASSIETVLENALLCIPKKKISEDKQTICPHCAETREAACQVSC